MVIFDNQTTETMSTKNNDNNNNNGQEFDDDNHHHHHNDENGHSTLEIETNNQIDTTIVNVKLKSQQQIKTAVFNHLNGFHIKDVDKNEDLVNRIDENVQSPSIICDHIDVMNENEMESSDSNPANTKDNDDNNFNDFQTSDEFDSQNNQIDQNQDDDFADFESFIPDEKNFANFSELNPEKEMKFNDDDDDFDDFADFTCNVSIEPIVNVEQTTKVVKNFNDHRELIKDAFQCNKINSIADDETVRISNDFFNEYICDQKARELWNNLQQLDLKLNFTFTKWKQSSSFKHLVEALKIDSRNVIPSDIFPTTTTTSYNKILQPTMYDHSTTTTIISTEDDSINMADDQCNKMPMNVFSTNRNLIKSTKIESKGEPSSSSSPFTWSSDHATHTTATATTSTTTTATTTKTTTNHSVFNNHLAQDLDFFETKYAIKNSNVSNINNKNDDGDDDDNKMGHHHDLIAEFDEFLRIDNESSSTMANNVPDKSVENKQTGDNYNRSALSIHSNKSTTTTTTTNRMNEQVLSAEALQILNELPNLSMMRAKVLLYPMVGNNNNNRSKSDLSPSSR